MEAFELIVFRDGKVIIAKFIFKYILNINFPKNKNKEQKQILLFMSNISY